MHKHNLTTVYTFKQQSEHKHQTFPSTIHHKAPSHMQFSRVCNQPKCDHFATMFANRHLRVDVASRRFWGRKEKKRRRRRAKWFSMFSRNMFGGTCLYVCVCVWVPLRKFKVWKQTQIIRVVALFVLEFGAVLAFGAFVGDNSNRVALKWCYRKTTFSQIV